MNEGQYALDPHFLLFLSLLFSSSSFMPTHLTGFSISIMRGCDSLNTVFPIVVKESAKAFPAFTLSFLDTIAPVQNSKIFALYVISSFHIDVYYFHYSFGVKFLIALLGIQFLSFLFFF